MMEKVLRRRQKDAAPRDLQKFSATGSGAYGVDLWTSARNGTRCAPGARCSGRSKSSHGVRASLRYSKSPRPCAARSGGRARGPARGLSAGNAANFLKLRRGR